jgi:FkbM family methyltransferase
MRRIISSYYQQHLKLAAEGFGIKSKLWLLINAFIRVPLFVAGGFSLKFNYIADKYLPEVTIKNENGIFKCRKGSSDFSVTKETFEKELTNYLAKNQPSVFVDIGANVGRYTIKMARQIGNRGKVIAIEADPENYEALVENIRLNKLQNVYAFNVACWDKEEDVKLFIGPMLSKGLSSIKAEAEVSDKTVTVHGTTLDNILTGLGIKEVDIVKIDVERAEKEVLLGMKDTIANSNKIEILFEAWDERYLLECKKVLQSYGLVVDDKKIEDGIYRARR